MDSSVSTAIFDYVTHLSVEPFLSISADYECKMTVGNAGGGKRLKLSEQRNDKCIIACIELKKTYKNVNGVAVRGKSCECIIRMNKIHPRGKINEKFKSCFLKPTKQGTSVAL